MDTTFISIHDLEDDARVLYTSDSVIDILGYTPDEVVNRPAWDFFEPSELPYARQFHKQRVSMDKAAVLAYCRVRDKNGDWVGCECCFTIVYDVMIVCTSIYRRDVNSQKRAMEAPVVRRIFTSSPKDPRYHMLSHLSAKFAQPAKQQLHEPRAALFLNRFTRTLSIMYATSGIRDIIGIPADEMRGRSFYYCIAENCLPESVKCLENAKGNDSIAYLRFWFRDPRQDDPPQPDNESDDDDVEMTTDTSIGGGVGLRSGSSSNAAQSANSMDVDAGAEDPSMHSSGESTHEADTHEAIFGEHRATASSTSSIGHSPNAQPAADPVELEAVISCTSDGLVVCLRKARPMIPHPTHRPSKPVYPHGIAAAPWAHEPILPPMETRPGAGFGTAFAPSLGPHGAQRTSISPPRAQAAATDQSDFMNAIREQAVFAWALTGINGSLEQYSQGKPMGESVPQDGLPIWESDPRGQSGESTPSGSGQASLTSRSPENERVGPQLFGDPGLNKDGSTGPRNGSSSDGNENSGSGTPF